MSQKQIDISIGKKRAPVGLNICRCMNITDYPSLTGKPSINGVMLVDDKSFEELGVENLTNMEILAIYKRVFKS